MMVGIMRIPYGCRLAVCIAMFSMSGIAQSPDHLSPAEVRAAIAAKPGIGFAYMEDMTTGLFTTTYCQAQSPSLSIYTPEGWLNARNIAVKQQFLPFNPEESDTRRVLTIISQGCASGTVAGPVCDSITRVALLSDFKGVVVIEAIENYPQSQGWHNGYGAQTVCSSLVSRFSMDDIQKVRQKNGQFVVATFNGTQLLKLYTVKEKYLKSLGLLVK